MISLSFPESYRLHGILSAAEDLKNLSASTKIELEHKSKRHEPTKSLRVKT